jgi:ABC-2 type transport system permease protein
MINEEPVQQQFSKSYLPVAVLLEGEFESVFRNRLPPEITGNKEINYSPESKPTKMVVVGDGDMIRNIAKKTGTKSYHYPLGYDRYSGNMFGNRDFILNVMNYMLDDAGLMNVRTRELKLRLLDKVNLNENLLMWQIINTIVPVVFIVLFAITVIIVKRRRYVVKNL